MQAKKRNFICLNFTLIPMAIECASICIQMVLVVEKELMRQCSHVSRKVHLMTI